ncbi:MAG TPA: diaminopimelate epimerase [Kofleriaceae bacterium]|nr:diaminopimelate epimerase [Kofleriaceae bacterium]
MSSIAFAKYHGCGNDFLVVDLRTLDDVRANAVQDTAVVRALCDRQFGVGGDGVLAILPPITAGADARMRVLNADGSEAEMCGNGIRCVVRELHDRGGVAKDTLVIDTGAGPLTCGYSTRTHQVTVDMGRPRLTRGEIPMTGASGERVLEVPLAIEGESLKLTGVSMGNPHAVAFVDTHWSGLRALAEKVGPSIEHHAWFPRRTNVELAHVLGGERIELVVWERGVGITLACGTGACATAVAACLAGRATAGHEIAVRLLGGELRIKVAADYSTVHMRGPAAHVFDGAFDVAHVLASARPD